MFGPKRAPGVLWALGLIFLLCLAPLVSAQPASEQPHVDRLTISGPIDPWVVSYLRRGLAAARRDGAEALIVALDTPGGSLNAMQQATTLLLNAPVPVVAYVSPSGAWAASAGTFIAMASHVLAMAPGTSLGAAHPVNASGGDIASDERLKVTNAAASLIESIAQQRGRNAVWAGRAVRDSLAATAEEAVTLGVSNLVAADTDDLLRQLDGRSVTVSSGQVTLRTAGARVDDLSMGLVESFLHTLVDPNIALILLQLGLLALVVELYNPGITFAGIVGGICLILALVALGNLPTNWGGAGLVLVSVILFMVDMKVNSVVLTVGGVASFVVGALLLFAPFAPRSPVWSTMSVSPMVIVALGGLALALFSLVLAAAIRGRRAPVLMGPAALIGAVGVTVTDLAPQGQVQLQSELWSAASIEGAIARGERVRVVAIRGLVLHVERARE